LQLLKKKHVLGYDDLTQKEQDHARTLPKGIYAENIMSQMWILQSATKISPTVQTDALSDIDINSPPAICRETKNPRPRHVQKNPMYPQQNLQKVTPMISTTRQRNRYWCTKSKPFINL
jgi:hypothetical protein